MRTTIDLPDDLLAIARSIARGQKQSLSQAVAELMWRGINPPEPAEISISPRTGLPVLHIGRKITSEDVRALEDEEDEYLASFVHPRSAGE